MSLHPILQKILHEPRPLSESQKGAITSVNRHIRMIAGAGAGKTETLTRKIVSLLLVDRVDPSSIVAFTFTEKAAANMKSRIYSRVRELGENALCSQLGEMYVGTIHGFCFQLLEDRFGYGSWGILDENQEMAYLMRVGWNLNLTGTSGYTEKCQVFKRSVGVVYNEMIPRDQLQIKSPEFFTSFSAYEGYLTSHHRLTFDRMIALTVENLRENPGVGDYIKYLIVDEYQDINRSQQELIQILGQGAYVFVVGDPRQTIYQFRGSDESCFEEFINFYKGSHTIPIPENRRSVEVIVSSANYFSATFQQCQYPPMIPMRPESGATHLVEFHDKQEEAIWIADEIARIVQNGSCRYGDIGILLRSVSTSGEPFIDLFRERHIPFIVGGKVGLFRRQEIAALAKIVVWAAPDGHFQKSRWDWKNKIEGDDLLTDGVHEWVGSTPDICTIDEITPLIEGWKHQIHDNVFDHISAMYHELLRILGILKLNPEDPEHAVIMANLGRFGDILTDVETAQKLGGHKISWPSLLKNINYFFNQYANGSYDERMDDDLSGIDAVNLMTMHQSKGLEWPVVFIPALVKGRFPSSNTGKEQNWLISKDLFNVNRYEGDEEGERKLMYVAMTRAKELLVMSYFTTMSGRRKGVSIFVEDLADCTDIEVLSPSEHLPSLALSQKGEDDEIQTFAAGELIQYSKCPYRYRINTIWGFQPGLNPYIGYGNALHHCMREAADLMKEGYDPVTAVASAVEDGFFMPFADAGRAQGLKNVAMERLINFAEVREDDMLRIREVETRIEYPLMQATVAGKVDVILHDGEGIEIRDYKTSDKVVTEEDASMQIRLYARGLAAIGEQVTRGSIAFLEDATITPVPISENLLEKAESHAEELISGIVKRDFSACPGEQCNICDFGKICRFA
jgi:DNA helicase II / ATP-dependent DNA helicase PcrA